MWKKYFWIFFSLTLQLIWCEWKFFENCFHQSFKSCTVMPNNEKVFLSLFFKISHLLSNLGLCNKIYNLKGIYLKDFFLIISKWIFSGRLQMNVLTLNFMICSLNKVTFFWNVISLTKFNKIGGFLGINY